MPKFLFALAALAAVACTPAAARPVVPGTRIVHYADLDLGVAAGRAALDRRIGAAVRAVCGTAGPTDPGALPELRACRVETLARIVRPAALRQAGTQ